MSYETVSVIGLGYIGLPTAAMFAAVGKKVIGVDVNKDVVDTISRGEIHIVEPDVDEIYQNVKRLTSSQALYNEMSTADNPYGDGFSCSKVLDGLSTIL